MNCDLCDFNTDTYHIHLKLKGLAILPTPGSCVARIPASVHQWAQQQHQLIPLDIQLNTTKKEMPATEAKASLDSTQQ